MEPPNFQETLEATLKAPFTPYEVFGNLRNLPAPDFGQMLGNILLWSFAGWTVRLVLQAAQSSSVPSGAFATVLGLAGALTGAAVLSFIVAGILHVLALLSGGNGSYARSYQIVSLASALAPIGALASQAPVLNMLPTAYGVYLVIRAVSLMHFTSVIQTGMVFGAAGVLALGGQWMAMRKLTQLRDQVAALQSAAAVLQAQGGFPSQNPGQPGVNPGASGLDLLRPPSFGAALGGSGDTVNLQQVQNIMQLAAQMSRQAAGTSSGQVSGLDLVRQGNSGGVDAASGLGSAPPMLGAGNAVSGQPANMEQVRQMQAWSYGMLQNLQKVMADPSLLQKMSPQQAAQMRQMMQLANNLSAMYQTRSNGGRQAAKLSDAEARQIDAQMQAIMNRFQTSLPAGSGISSENVPASPSDRPSSVPSYSNPQQP